MTQLKWLVMGLLIALVQGCAVRPVAAVSTAAVVGAYQASGESPAEVRREQAARNASPDLIDISLDAIKHQRADYTGPGLRDDNADARQVAIAEYRPAGGGGPILASVIGDFFVGEQVVF